jgi:hypothetical protein
MIVLSQRRTEDRGHLTRVGLPEFPAFKVASLRGESSNQLFETLEEWNDYLERYSAPPTGVAISSARRCRVSTGFPVSFGLYLDEPRRQAGR